MAKKKKNKNSQNSPTKTPPPTKGYRQAQTVEANDTQDSQYSAIAVSVSPECAVKKVPRSISQENNRVISIHENDARGFSVRQGEEVIVLQIDTTDDRGPLSMRTSRGPWSPRSAKVSWTSSNNDDDGGGDGGDNDLQPPTQPRFVSICRVAVSQNNMSTPRSNSAGSSAKKNKPAREGEAHILPITLAQKLVDDPLDNAPTSDATPLKTTIAENDEALGSVPEPLKSPTTNKQFTFETFVHSPAKMSQTPSGRSSTPQTKTGKRVKKCIALLSLQKNQEAYKLLTGEAAHLTLRLTEASSSFFAKNVLMKAEQILGRMVRALCQGMHVSVDEIITISFQGKKLQFVIKDIHTNPKKALDHNVEALTRSVSELSIHNKVKNGDDEHEDNTDRMSDEICRQLRDGISKPALFRIVHQTRFIFDFDEEDQTPVTDISTVQEEKLKLEEPTRKKIVAGLDSISDQIHSLLIPTLFHPERFPRSGPIRAPKGLLIHGTSGCGKSLLAEQVALDIEHYSKAVKRISKITINVVRVNCASIQSSTSIMGEAEKQLTRLFEKAERRRATDSVSTLFLMDDIHLICPRRGAAGDGTGVERVASTLLALMDGIGKQTEEETSTIKGNIAILAICTNPSLLDPALRRAGRLDTEVEIPSPDEKAKSEIFSMCLDNLRQENVAIPHLSGTDLLSLSRLGKGFTGADCVLSIKEATRNAILRQMEEKNDKESAVELTYSDIEQAVRITKPSSIKSITVEIPKVPWASIGGMDDVKRSLREAIELPLTHAHLFTALCIPPPRGVLLYGPPGCSKTLMARALATEGNMNFLAVKGPELLSKWLGESERALASLFRRARLASPCVIFFDEIDAIASKRGSGESSGGERMLSQLLTELDGVTSTAGNDKQQPRVIVVGATNRPDLLDAALTRPGRIDRMIYVGIPDLETRKAIFKLQLKGKSCDPDIDFSELAHVGEGFSGAEIVSICRESALFAIEENEENSSEEPRIKMKHLIRSIDETKKQITPEMLAFYSSYGKASSVIQQ